MRVFKMEKGNLVPFLRSLEEFGEVWGPVKKGNSFVYAHEDPEKFDLSAIRTLIPAKKFFLPKVATILKFKNGAWTDNRECKKRVIFGLHPCDLHALNIYHEFYTRIYEDPYYTSNREATLIIGLSCLPDDNCFCNLTDTSTIEEGFDLFFTELDDKFLVWVGSPRGDEVLAKRKDMVEDITQNDIKEYIEWRKKREKMFKVDLSFTGLPEIVSASYDSDIWDKMGAACLSCGTCTMVCPSCTCFDVEDEYDIRNDELNRKRKWYSCFFREYSMVAGGHNFREARAERLRLWYTHKLVGFMSEYGEPACVGCGRCVVSCPVGINVLSVVRALTGEKNDAFWAKTEVKQL